MQVIHQIEPVWDGNSTVLFLGTMPSPASRHAGFFYMHPQNRFWPVIAAVCSEGLVYRNDGSKYPAGREKIYVTEAIEERRSLILRHGIALWDVLAGCEINGAEDSSIKSPVPNDFRMILNSSRIRRVFCTGQTAFRLYMKMCAPVTGINAVCLPSTSPANQGRWPFEKLLEAYSVLND